MPFEPTHSDIASSICLRQKKKKEKNWLQNFQAVLSMIDLGEVQKAVKAHCYKQMTVPFKQIETIIVVCEM